MILNIIYVITVICLLAYISLATIKLYSQKQRALKDISELLDQNLKLELEIKRLEKLRNENIEHKILMEVLAEGDKKPKTLISKLEKKYGVKLSYQDGTMLIEFTTKPDLLVS
jgi:hypothetical protein